MVSGNGLSKMRNAVTFFFLFLERAPFLVNSVTDITWLIQIFVSHADFASSCNVDFEVYLLFCSMINSKPQKRTKQNLNF